MQSQSRLFTKIVITKIRPKLSKRLQLVLFCTIDGFPERSIGNYDCISVVMYLDRHMHIVR